MGETSADALVPGLMVDLIISLDGYASAEGWPGWWGLEGPEYWSTSPRRCMHRHPVRSRQT